MQSGARGAARTWDQAADRLPGLVPVVGAEQGRGRTRWVTRTSAGLPLGPDEMVPAPRPAAPAFWTQSRSIRRQLIVNMFYREI